MRKKPETPDQPQLDEASVVVALKEGHREFLRFLVRRTANISEAEDVLQDFYLKVVRSARTIRTPGALKGWLAQVLRRTLTDHYRKSAVRRSTEERLLSSEDIALSVDDDAERAVCACLYRILPTLPSGYAQIIWRVDLLGQERHRVARSLHISVNNLGVRIHRARLAVRAALERFCITCPEHGFLNCACENFPKQLAEREWFDRSEVTRVRKRPLPRLKEKRPSNHPRGTG
jgi:RNA polymerase sigma factor (sigma-70 family)